METSLQYNSKVMNFIVFLVVIWEARKTVSETPYHYISQVPEPSSQTVSPKPLFSPHDTRREGNGRKEVSYQGAPGSLYNYGTKQIGGTGGSAGHNIVYTNTASNIQGDGQTYWYPLYSDIQYPGLVDYSQTPYVLSYGALPQGYEPSVPLGGDPLGYSYSYQAGDHSRHEVSDGKGNFYSSFSFIPPAGNIGQQPQNIPLNPDLNIFSTRAPPTVNIPARRPIYSTELPSYPSRSPSTSKPLFIASQSSKPFGAPTAKPLIGSSPDPNYNDYANGYYFESKKLYPTRIPPKPFTAGSHALSTNIQYDSVARESSSKSSTVSSGSRSVTIEPNEVTPTPLSSTDRSYQTLSRSLPMAFVSQRISTVPTPYSSSEKTSTQISRRLPGSGSEVLALRSASRRSTTEKSLLYNDNKQSVTSPSPISSPKKPSVIQKIPRKLKPQNVTYESDDLSLRPPFIDDLTSFAYSADKLNLINNTIVQFKPTNNNNFNKKSSSTINDIKNSTRISEAISKDGYITGNKTYLGGLGLTANIHY